MLRSAISFAMSFSSLAIIEAETVSAFIRALVSFFNLSSKSITFFLSSSLRIFDFVHSFWDACSCFFNPVIFSSNAATDFSPASLAASISSFEHFFSPCISSIFALIFASDEIFSESNLACRDITDVTTASFFFSTVANSFFNSATVSSDCFALLSASLTTPCKVLILSASLRTFSSNVLIKISFDSNPFIVLVIVKSRE
mmetsp:Transcript_1101/g.2407  ORF Transcript_1101/g.2407 Transcript_1101/m.2407 type:complete len:200 (-) Transcript_1101:65-664(-)